MEPTYIKVTGGSHDANICLGGDAANYDFSDYTPTTFYYKAQNTYSSEYTFTGTLDLSETEITSAGVNRYGGVSIKFPSTLQTYDGAHGGCSSLDFSLCSNLKNYSNTVCFSCKDYCSIPATATLDSIRIHDWYQTAGQASTFEHDLSACKAIKSGTKVYISGNKNEIFKLSDCGEVITEGACAVMGLTNLKSTTKMDLDKAIFLDENPCFYTTCTDLYIHNCTNISSLEFRKPYVEAPAAVLNIKLDNTGFTSISEFPENATISQLKIMHSKVSDVESLCNNLLRNGADDENKIVICNDLYLSSDSLASSDVAGFSYIKPLLELKKAGLNTIKFGGRYVDDAAINYLKNGATIDGTAYVGFGANNVTRIN